jgi:hypothetical protein
MKNIQKKKKKRPGILLFLIGPTGRELDVFLNLHKCFMSFHLSLRAPLLSSSALYF